MKTNVAVRIATFDLSSRLRNSRFGFRVCSPALAVLLLTVVCSADEQAAEDQQSTQIKATQKWLHEYYEQQAATYEFYFDEAQTQRLGFVDRSIFHWKQDNDWSGGLFVWTHRGRPEVLGCILASPSTDGKRSVGHEFHTLALQSLPRAKTVSGTWQPKTGIKLTPMEDAAPPVATAALRLTQLRKLAREFSVTMKFQDQPWELRLLPQPIYRYAAPDVGVIDGGLFAYVWTRGTDPETLLLLECRDEAPKPRWYYSLLRFTTRPLQVKLNDREVWNSPGVGNSIRGDSQEPYVTFNAGFVSVPTDQP
jgi:hypothetical protein